MSYEDTIDHLLDELGCIDLLVRSVLENRAEELSNQDLGLAERLRVDNRVTIPNVDPRLVAPDSVEDEFKGHRSQIETKRATAIKRGVDLRLVTLADAFGLSREHLDVLLLALFPDVDPAAGEMFAELHNDVANERPTVRLVAELFSMTPAEFLNATELFGMSSPLREYDLLTLEPPETGGSPSPKLNYSLRVDDRIYAYLLDHGNADIRMSPARDTDVPTTLESLVTESTAEATLDELLISPDKRAELDALPADDGTGRRLYFHGPAGGGPRRAAEALCRSRTYLEIDLRDVMEAGPDALDMVVREVTLRNKPLIVTGADAATFCHEELDISLEDIIDRFEIFENDLFLIGQAEWIPTDGNEQVVDSIVGFYRPTIPQRRQFWTERATEMPVDIDPEQMASTFDLTLGQLEAAMTTARTIAGGDQLTIEHILEGCRAQSSAELDELAQHIDPNVSREDVILQDDTEDKLDRLQAHVSNRGRIYDDWGFRAQDGSAGVVALFKGKPGTGKTMSAEALANEVGMSLYKIDLSSVVSKYIGETEEKLEEIFQAAEQSNAILLFDEADSVFGDRAEVSDATDRYANAEVNYLLQRIETYDGVVLLTTNYSSNIDEAFMRRINHIVRFERPQAETREAIWETAFPDNTPTDGIDSEWLSQFDFSGGEIASLGKRIAVEAANSGADAVTMKHVVRVIERDYRDSGRVVRQSEFEPYEDHLERPAQSSDGRRRTRG